MTNIAPIPNPTTSPSTSPSKPTVTSKLSTLVQSIAFDIAGLGCVGGAIYAYLFTKDTAAIAGLTALGGTYLGVKVPS